MNPSSSLIQVSIVMPCLNEVQTLQPCIEEAQAALIEIRQRFQLDGEVVVADNGSTDGSIELAEKLGARVVHVKKPGYGNALMGGFEGAYGNYLVMADSDMSYDFREAVPIVEKLLQGYELCMGSRFKGTIMPGAMPWKNRYIGNPVLTGVLNLLFNSRLSDAHSGIRGLTRDAYKRLRLTSSGMEFASEMVIKAALLNLKRTEVPVTLRPDGRDRPPHLRPWRDGWRHLRYIFMLSPTWLYFVPALLFGMIGFIILALLLANPGENVVRLGPIWFGDHWVILSMAAIIAAHQAVILGLATTLYGIQEGYRRLPGWFISLYRYVRLEPMLVVGIFLLLLGALVFATVILTWSGTGFGDLNRLRELAAGITVALIGFQTISGGFLMAIISGNEADVYEVAQRVSETHQTSSFVDVSDQAKAIH